VSLSLWCQRQQFIALASQVMVLSASMGQHGIACAAEEACSAAASPVPGCVVPAMGMVSQPEECGHRKLAKAASDHTITDSATTMAKRNRDVPREFMFSSLQPQSTSC